MSDTTGSRARMVARSWGPTAGAIAVCVGLLFVWQAAFYAHHHPVIDHVAYREQAEQLLDGHLSMPLDADAPSWAVRFTTPTDHGRVFKYLPGTAAIGAVSLELTGDVGLALAGSLGLVVLATAGIAARLGWSPNRRALAALVVGASPVMLSNSTVLLSYVPSLALSLTAVWMVLAATLDRGTAVPAVPAPLDTALRDDVTAPAPRPEWHRLLLLAGAGLVLGLALLVRQIEVVTWTAVLVGWCLLRPGAPALERVKQAVILLVATIPGILLVLAVNRHVTGDPLSFPFTLVSPQDGMGWGLRRVLPTDALETFHLVDGVRTSPRASFDLLAWTLAGPALAVGAAVTVWIRRRSPVHWLLVVLAGSVPLAFLFHWANAHAVRGGFYMTVGPFYYLPCVPPLVLLGVEGLARLPRRAVVVGVTVVVLLQAAFLTNHLWDQWGYGRGGNSPAVTASPTPR